MNKKYYLSAAITVVFFLIFWAVYGQVQRTPPGRQAWEYKSIAMLRSVNGEFSSWYENSGGGNIQLAAPVNMAAKLNELGNEGWELITVTPMSNSTSGNSKQVHYYLKRPK